MKKTDPLLLILTAVVGLCMLAIVARVIATDSMSEGVEKLLPILATMFGGLVTAIVTGRGKKGGDDEG